MAAPWRPSVVCVPGRTLLHGLVIGIALSACSPPLSLGPSAGDVTCGGGPAFSASLLDGPANAESAPGPAAEALRRHLATENIDIDWLPDAGWIEVSNTGGSALYLAADPAAEGSWFSVSLSRDADKWRVSGWGGCSLQPDVGFGMGIASFRVEPAALDPAATEIPVLVTERACNSGEDARGRIVVSAIRADDDAVTVTLAVRTRGGAQSCPSNPETPFVLELEEPLGDRQLLDGSSIPARDATVCPDIAMCP
jgi:hypothetical protein